MCIIPPGKVKGLIWVNNNSVSRRETGTLNLPIPQV